MRNHEFSTAFKAVAKILRKHGLRKCLEHLREIEEKGTNSFSYEMSVAVVRQVRTHYKLTHDELFQKNHYPLPSEARKRGRSDQDGLVQRSEDPRNVLCWKAVCNTASQLGR